MMLTRSSHSGGSRLDDRTSTMTRLPSLSRRVTICAPTKPDAPVTSALAGAMRPHGVAVMLDLPQRDLRGISRIGGEVPIPAGGQVHGLGKRQRRRPAQERSRLGAVEMQEPRLREASGRIGDLRPGPACAEPLDQILDRARRIVAGTEIPVISRRAIAL